MNPYYDDPSNVKVVETPWPPLKTGLETEPPSAAVVPERKADVKPKSGLVHTPEQIKRMILDQAEENVTAALDHLVLGIQWFELGGDQVDRDLVAQVEKLLETVSYRRSL